MITYCKKKSLAKKGLPVPTLRYAFRRKNKIIVVCISLGDFTYKNIVFAKKESFMAVISGSFPHNVL